MRRRTAFERGTPAQAGQAALAYACELILRRALSEAALADRLQGRGAPPEAITYALAEAARLGLVDDARLARELAEAGRRKGYWRRRVQMSLARERLPETCLSDALAGVFPDEEEEQAARAALQGRVLPLEPSKLAAWLERRGYSPAVSWRLARELTAASGSAGSSESP